jgi:two-component system sensor histidine kinase KdpD
LVAEILRRVPDISVHVVPARSGPIDLPRPSRAPQSLPPLRSFANAFGYSILGLAAGLAVRQGLGISNVTLVMLVAVLTSAVTLGLWPSLFACLVSALAYNFFFLPPLYTFTIADPENVITLLVFFLVAVIASNLTARVRTQAVVARDRAATTEDLYLFARKLAGVISLDDLLWATVYQVAHMLKVQVVLLLPEGENLEVRAGYPPEDTLDQGDLAAARWALDQGSAAGRGSDTLPGARRLFLPMRTGRGIVAIIGLHSNREGPLLTPDQRRLLDSLTDQAALAIERLQLAREMDKARVATETEKLRSALFTSISHDLRTPLASILGSVTSLKQYGDKIDAADQDALLATIQDEAERLNHFIANLLDMTRLESGALAPRMDAVDVTDITGSVLRRTAKLLAGHRIVLALDDDLPLVRVDPVLFEQVMFNLLDNAAKYTPQGSEVTVRGRHEGNMVRISVEDEGEGLPEMDRERVFDKFYRVMAADRKRAGTGLGLSIARGFMEAMGGSIIATNREGRKGAIFILAIPVAK